VLSLHQKAPFPNNRKWFLVRQCSNIGETDTQLGEKFPGDEPAIESPALLEFRVRLIGPVEAKRVLKLIEEKAWIQGRCCTPIPQLFAKSSRRAGTLEGRSAPSIYPELHAQESTVGEFVRVLVKRKWTVLACLFTIFLVVAIASLKMTPVYEATGRIAINKPDSGVVNFNNSPTFNADYFDSTELDTEVKISHHRSPGLFVLPNSLRAPHTLTRQIPSVCSREPRAVHLARPRP